MNSDQQRITDWEYGVFDDRIDRYSLFLRDGDFDQYMPYIYNTNSPKKVVYQRELVRSLWIRSRFCELGSLEHQYYAQLCYTELDKLIKSIGNYE